MEMIKDLVSVIMTNYNTAENMLREAVDSILSQTYSHFEMIIVDDCSTDNSLEILESYNDSRIQIIKNERNIGLTKSLNKAIEVARGEFIARMDADDICNPERLKKQVDFLKKNNNVIVCGTWAKLFGELKENKYANEFVCRTIPAREEFRIMLLFGNYPNIVHSSAMFNRNLLLKNNIKYNENYIYAQDYRMWVECSKYAECAIVPEVLINIRVRGGSISTEKREVQNNCALAIMQEQMRALGIELDDNTKSYHINFLSSRHTYDIAYRKWIKTIIEANKGKNIYNQRILEKILWKKWAEIVYFGLKSCGFIEKINRLATLPLTYYPELITIRCKRKKKQKGICNE